MSNKQQSQGSNQASSQGRSGGRSQDAQQDRQQSQSGKLDQQGAQTRDIRQAEQSQGKRDAQDDRMGRDQSLQQGSDHTNRSSGQQKQR